jgi:thioredoxin reductase
VGETLNTENHQPSTGDAGLGTKESQNSSADIRQILIFATILQKYMKDKNKFDVIIVGGSYAGLSAAMALGRSLRNVLILDSGTPCNQRAPYSHNFITQDGKTPHEITTSAKVQVIKYDTIKFINGLVTDAKKLDTGFEVSIQTGDVFFTRKLLFATGLTDNMPAIPGFKDGWGISILHCPYCHGYEVKNKDIGIVGNGELGFELARLVHNWTNRLVLFTNGKSTLTPEQTKKLTHHHINIIETEILELEHSDGHIRDVLLKDNTRIPVTALFAKPDFKQQCAIPQNLGCELTDAGYIKIDDLQRTSIDGVYAAGDNTPAFRAVAAAVAAGNKAGAVINKELIDDSF